MPVSAGVSADVIRDRSALAALAEEWSALPLPVAAPCPTSGPEFLEAWLPTLGGDSEPRVVAVRRDGRLVGVVPLVATTYPPHAGGRQVSLAGSRRPPVIDIADVRVVPGEEAAVAERVVGLLEDAADTWDTLYMGHVAAASRTLAAVMAEIELRRWPIATRARTAAVAEMNGDWEAYRAGLGRSMRRMPRRLRRLQEMGDLRVELGLTGDAGEAALEDLIGLYRRRWGAGNPLESEGYRDFLRRFRAALDPDGARVAGLWLDGRPLAAELVLREGTREQYLMVASTRDGPGASESPGTLLDFLLAERASADGITEMHLLHTMTKEKLGWATRLDSELTWIAVSPLARRRVAATLPITEAAILGQRVRRHLGRAAALRKQ